MFRAKYTSPAFTRSALRYTYMSGKMKIERYTSEGKRELAPSTRIQITSSNATSSATTTLGRGRPVYAKRSCNPALAHAPCVRACMSGASDSARVYARARVHACWAHDIPCTLRDVRHVPTSL